MTVGIKSCVSAPISLVKDKKLTEGTKLFDSASNNLEKDKSLDKGIKVSVSIPRSVLQDRSLKGGLDFGGATSIPVESVSSVVRGENGETVSSIEIDSDNFLRVANKNDPLGLMASSGSSLR